MISRWVPPPNTVSMKGRRRAVCLQGDTNGESAESTGRPSPAATSRAVGPRQLDRLEDDHRKLAGRPTLVVGVGRGEGADPAPELGAIGAGGHPGPHRECGAVHGDGHVGAGEHVAVPARISVVAPVRCHQDDPLRLHDRRRQHGRSTGAGPTTHRCQLDDPHPEHPVERPSLGDPVGGRVQGGPESDHRILGVVGQAIPTGSFLVGHLALRCGGTARGAHPPGFRPGERRRDAGRHGPRRLGRHRPRAAPVVAGVPPVRGGREGAAPGGCGAAWLPRARHAGSGGTRPPGGGRPGPPSSSAPGLCAWDRPRRRRP